ncbi:hypothetical protein HDU98_007114 [Podochytrium sp. JEL0797]|nr:hypothetical protein HDU98_007114 [Podochytrium sp. JEL0797]
MPVFREKGFILGNPALPTVITIDGFLHSSHDARGWTKLITTAFPTHTWISLQWDASAPGVSSSNPFDWTTAILSPGDTIARIPGAFATHVGSSVTAFNCALEGCEKAAYLLADAVMRYRGKVVLVGYSLGASLAFHALVWLARSRRLSIEQSGGGREDMGVVECKVDRVVLLGSACPRYRSQSGWTFAAQAVHGNILNLYSPQDEVLNALGAVTGVERAGVGPIEVDSESLEVGDKNVKDKIINVRCDEVCGHLDWKPSVASARLV